MSIRFLLMALVFILPFVGCDTNKSSLMGPDIPSDVVYASTAGDPTSDDVRDIPQDVTKLQVTCYQICVPPFKCEWAGGDHCADLPDPNPEIAPDTYIAAPRFKLVNALP